MSPRSALSRSAPGATTVQFPPLQSRRPPDHAVDPKGMPEVSGNRPYKKTESGCSIGEQLRARCPLWTPGAWGAARRRFGSTIRRPPRRGTNRHTGTRLRRWPCAPLRSASSSTRKPAESAASRYRSRSLVGGGIREFFGASSRWRNLGHENASQQDAEFSWWRAIVAHSEWNAKSQ